MAEAYRRDIDVESSHVDMFGHVNHARYLEYMEWARFGWAEAGGAPIPRMIEEERVGPAILRANVRYRRECRLGDQLTVTVEPLSARRDIGRIRQVITDRRSGDIVCEAELTFVMLDLSERKATKLPAVFLEQIRE